MNLSALSANWSAVRLEAFRRRSRLSVAGRLVLAAALAGMTGLAAQVRIPLPSTPVPATGQVFAVLLAGALGGSATGALSQVLYLAAGIAGVPWFAHASAGLPLGPSGGYLLGFVPAAAMVGWLTDRHVRLRSIAGQTFLMMLAVGVIYLCGAVQFALVCRTGLAATLAGAVLPFIPFDLAKALCVAAIASVILPKGQFNADPKGTANVS
jgi:biotin transport system substrate-specific component